MCEERTFYAAAWQTLPSEAWEISPVREHLGEAVADIAPALVNLKPLLFRAEILRTRATDTDQARGCLVPGEIGFRCQAA